MQRKSNEVTWGLPKKHGFFTWKLFVCFVCETSNLLQRSRFNMLIKKKTQSHFWTGIQKLIPAAFPPTILFSVAISPTVCNKTFSEKIKDRSKTVKKLLFLKENAYKNTKKHHSAYLWPGCCKGLFGFMSREKEWIGIAKDGASF